MTKGVRAMGAAWWRQRALVALAVVLIAVCATVGVRAAPKSYSATATLAAPGAAGASASEGELDAMRASLAALADSEAVVAAARERLGSLRTSAALRDSIQGRWRHGTVLVTVTAHDRDPRVAARVANTVAAALVAAADPGSATQALDVALTELAVVPTASDHRDLPLVAGLAALIALGLVAAAVVVRDRRTHTVDDAATVEAAAGAPLLAHLASPGDLTTLPTLETGTAPAGAFALLRASVERQVRESGFVLLVVAGITLGDLNVWVGANLAIALAGRGHRVLLADGRMGEQFGRAAEAGPDTAGLYEVLRGAELGEATSPGPVAGLRVLPSGAGGDQPVEELLRDRFVDVVAGVERRFDVVVVLGPPLAVSDDARTMSAAGSLLLTVPEGQVPVSTLRRQADRVRAGGARLLGVVLVRRTPPAAVMVPVTVPVEGVT